MWCFLMSSTRLEAGIKALISTDMPDLHVASVGLDEVGVPWMSPLLTVLWIFCCLHVGRRKEKQQSWKQIGTEMRGCETILTSVCQELSLSFLLQFVFGLRLSADQQIGQDSCVSLFLW